MGRIVFVKYDTKEEASQFAAELITTIFGLLPASKTKVLGTATGQSPVLTYQEIMRRRREHRDYRRKLY